MRTETKKKVSYLFKEWKKKQRDTVEVEVYKNYRIVGGFPGWTDWDSETIEIDIDFGEIRDMAEDYLEYDEDYPEDKDIIAVFNEALADWIGMNDPVYM